MKITFNHIINNISSDELIVLKTKDIHKNISAFARWIYKGHPGWPFWNKTVHDEFKKEIVTLYTKANSIKTTEELLKKLYTIALQTIPDRHFSISYNQKRILNPDERKKIKNKIFDDLIPNPKVGQNLAKTDLETLEKMGIKLYMREDLSNIGVAWIFVGEIDPKIGIVACTQLTTQKPPTGEFSQEQFNKLTQMVDAVKKHYPTWDAIIVDLRDNSGGDSRFFNQITSLVNGGVAQPIFKKLWVRNTPENILLLKEKQKITHQFCKEDFKKFKILWFYKKALPIKPNRKHVRILINRLVESSGEGAVFQFGKCPTYKTVGENTGGCCTGFDPVSVSLPNGGIIKIATRYAIRPRNIQEGIGISPDVPTPNKDAFEVALKDLKQILIKKTQKHILYNYAPKDDDILKNGLWSPSKAPRKALSHYFGRARTQTKTGVLKYLESTARGRSRSVSVITDPINKKCTYYEWTEDRCLCAIDFDKLYHDGLVETIYRCYGKKMTPITASQIKWNEKLPWDKVENGLFFKVIPHYMIVLRDGVIPSQYISLDPKIDKFNKT